MKCDSRLRLPEKYKIVDNCLDLHCPLTLCSGVTDLTLKGEWNVSLKEWNGISIFKRLVTTHVMSVNSCHSCGDPAAGSIHFASGCCLSVHPWTHVPSHHRTCHILGFTRHGVMLLATVEELLHNPIWNPGVHHRNNNKHWRDYNRIWRHWVNELHRWKRRDAKDGSSHCFLV